MVDAAIVTIIDKNNTEIGDFELPLKVSVSELSKKIEAVLNAMDSDKYQGISDLRIEYKSKPLHDDETLYENGIWDGSIIKIVF